jgi:hypothetical protein
VPQHELKDFVGDRHGSARRFRPYDVADDTLEKVPSENHVAAMQDLIYARFAAGEETTVTNTADGSLEDTVALMSRIAGLVVLGATLVAMAFLIF